MATLRMFAAARVAAGRGSDELPGDTVAAVLDAARGRYGAAFSEVLATCRIWVNGSVAEPSTPVAAGDEVAVLPPVSGGGVATPGDRESDRSSAAGADGSPLDELSLYDLRQRRAELQDREDAVSYVRRVAQGRADVARDARAQYSDDGDPTPVYIRADLESGLSGVLSNRLLGGDNRPPRPIVDRSDHPLSAELDTLCAEHGFSRLDELTGDELDALVSAIDGFERSVSAQRQEIFAELDAVTDAIVERLAANAGRDREQDTDS